MSLTGTASIFWKIQARVRKARRGCFSYPKINKRFLFIKLCRVSWHEDWVGDGVRMLGINMLFATSKSISRLCWVPSRAVSKTFPKMQVFIHLSCEKSDSYKKMNQTIRLTSRGPMYRHCVGWLRFNAFGVPVDQVGGWGQPLCPLSTNFPQISPIVSRSRPCFLCCRLSQYKSHQNCATPSDWYPSRTVNRYGYLGQVCGYWKSQSFEILITDSVSTARLMLFQHTRAAYPVLGNAVIAYATWRLRPSPVAEGMIFTKFRNAGPHLNRCVG